MSARLNVFGKSHGHEAIYYFLEERDGSEFHPSKSASPTGATMKRHL